MWIIKSWSRGHIWSPGQINRHSRSVHLWRSGNSSHWNKMGFSVGKRWFIHKLVSTPINPHPGFQWVDQSLGMENICHSLWRKWSSDEVTRILQGSSTTRMESDFVSIQIWCSVSRHFLENQTKPRTKYRPRCQTSTYSQSAQTCKWSTPFQTILFSWNSQSSRLPFFPLHKGV